MNGDSSQSAGPSAAAAAAASARDSLLVTRVEGMHAHTCETAISQSVGALPGVREVEVDFPSGQASVIFDARKVTAHQILATIEAAGYRCADHALGSGDGGSAE